MFKYLMRNQDRDSCECNETNLVNHDVIQQNNFDTNKSKTRMVIPGCQHSFSLCHFNKL